MSDQENQAARGQQSRREFIKATSAVVAGGAVLGVTPALAASVHVGGTDEIKIALIGCGGRGNGAVQQALETKGPVKLWALADAFQDRLDGCLSGAQQHVERGKRDNNPLLTDSTVDVPKDRQFVGLDAYKHCIESGADLILLATPPGFRPQHLTAAVNANKHVFCEKPCATDSPGVREVMAAQKLAQTKNLALVSGFCWRYNNMIQEAMQRVHNGELGRLVAHYSTYYTNPVKPMPPESERPAGMSDIEWQIRNWYNFTWLCGDSLVEQAVHNADKIMWVMKDQPPLSCVAVGGRAVPANGGNIYDHFDANYLFPNGYRVFLANRQSTGCYNGTHDYLMGTDATLVLGVGQPRIETPDGKIKWQFAGEEYDMYQREHDVLFQSIRAGKPKNDDLNLATSTLLAIMGRHAAYSGQQITWDQALNSQVSLVPKPVDWTAKHEVPGLAIPGRSQVV